MSRRPLALLLLVAAACGAAACGRTELDQIPGDGGAAGSSAAGRGGGGASGRGGGAGMTGSGGQGPVAVTCGQDICVPGTQTCCIQANSQTCIPAQAQCAGASIGCLDGAACPGATLCCLSLVGGSTSCQTAQLCGIGGGLFLCTSDGQCPGAASHCCRLGDTGVCSAQPCP